MSARQTLAQTKSARSASRNVPPVPFVASNQYFRVSFGSVGVSFARISNLQRSVEFEALAEGGWNEGVHVLTKPSQQGGTLTFEKGVTTGSPAMDASVRTMLTPGRRICVAVTITLMVQTSNGWEGVRAWGFDDGLVTRAEIGNLDALGSEIVFEKLEITHAGLTEVKV